MAHYNHVQLAGGVVQVLQILGESSWREQNETPFAMISGDGERTEDYNVIIIRVFRPSPSDYINYNSD